ncbi:MAG TPA: DUF4097 family beta strand repeat-containing protein [Ktedonosporobacter sp.]|jgi:hypothetical protein|nr:DUF4097 family beta strand repeat-containing protein [Ktedonosporobacter sp.]
MSNQESSFTEPERRVYEARNVNSDPREQGQQYQREYSQTYGGSGQQQQVGEKLYAPNNRRPRRRGLLLILALLILIVLAGGSFLSQIGIFTSTQQSTNTHSVSITGHPRLVIHDDSGTVHIHTGGNSSSVVITETKHATGLGSVSLNDMHVTYGGSGNTVEITAQDGINPLFFGSKGIDLDITAPNTSDVVVTDGSGQVEINDITGQVQAETGSGSVTVNNLNGPATLKTGSGTITVQGLVGQASMTTGSGDIEVKGATLSGQSTMKTGSGSIDFSGSIDPAGSYNFGTGSGSITVAVPASSAFKLDATTDSGTVTNGFGSNSVGSGQQAGLQLHTGSGDISLQKN